MAAEQHTTNPCKKLHELPSVATDWQQTTWHPNCEHYSCGTCGNPVRTDSDAACPFDEEPLPLREVAVDTKGDQRQKPLKIVLHDGRENQRLFTALEQAIRARIASRTGGRIQSLKVELMGNKVVIRGMAPCYHVKQLALQEVLEVIRSAHAAEVEVILLVEVCSAASASGKLL
jgi:hypothetical protein